MENQRKKGSNYEEKAAHFLTEQGYQVKQRNYRCRLGEIDIIAVDHGYLVFIEVKYRRNSSFGMPTEAVDYRKQRNISKVAQHYLMRNHIGDVPIRFDVVSILGESVQVYKHAFEFCG